MPASRAAPSGVERPSSATDLYWLPYPPGWAEQLTGLEFVTDPRELWQALVAMANWRLDIVKTNRLDAVLRRKLPHGPTGLATQPVRLAVLGSSSTSHLCPAIRVAALRRGMWLETYEAPYGQYLQEILDPGSRLHSFRPTVILFAFDANLMVRGGNIAQTAKEARATRAETTEHVRSCWRLARDSFGCAIVQQTVLPVFLPLLGNNEQRLPGSPATCVSLLNEALREACDADGVDLLSVDALTSAHGLGSWHDPTLWHRAKQEISPSAAPLYGDHVGRLLAARQGRSRKCLVLDLDNTIWGGVIGDDGLHGIVLGQGSAQGEAFLSFQRYARDLSRRGIILAICSKNDEANALAPFEQHADMLLKRSDIACLVANWDDKVRNLQVIAERLNIGLDSLVFVDDNPFERNLVRSALPIVAVPEIPDDPALFARCISDAGYFESATLTDEDFHRVGQYLANAQRTAARAQAVDLEGYLAGLNMKLTWGPFDRTNLARVVQLINKTNQFNLTTRRYSEPDIVDLMRDETAFGLHLRLVDAFGDNGLISIVIGRAGERDRIHIDTWLMSCRVLGRRVEQATLNLLASEARRRGVRYLVGEYRPTARNRMVRDHYAKLGFSAFSAAPDGPGWILDLSTYNPTKTPMSVSP